MIPIRSFIRVILLLSIFAGYTVYRIASVSEIEARWSCQADKP